tara:strand:+ start:5024 stop:5476 length:453 start_codon:yes stop_codon:yes gene_type:complete
MNYYWALFAFLAMLVSSLHTITHKYLTIYNNNFNNISVAFIFIFTGLFSLLYLIYNYKQVNEVITNKNSNTIILLSIILAFIILCYNFCISNSLINAPNISYCHLIVNLNVVLSLLASYLLFKQKINTKTFIGIIIALFGVGIVVYHSNE